ncbi:MAG: ABC transporter permease [Lewinellaceae bacterium]|nr:ABC transporter permease [Lewinellaceae bacterium]
MIYLMAWRNIWRNPTRSRVVILAIALGIWAALFMSGFATGMMRNYIQNAITNVVSHIQIHHPEYQADNNVRYTIPGADSLRKTLLAIPEVKAVSVRTLVNGMIASSQTARGVQVKAITPGEEATVGLSADKIVEGDFFAEDRKNNLLMSKKLADRLHVALRSKVVLTFQDLGGNITSAAFRITGLYAIGDEPFEEGHVFVRRQDLNRLLVADLTDSLNVEQHLAHEIALLLSTPDQVDPVQAELQKRLPGLRIETYREVAPDLRLYESQVQSVSWVYLIVIMLALVFGIINTMLMTVLERYKELGMLMAIGMNKWRVFRMIMLETLFLSLAGAPLGLLLGWGTITFLGHRGLDLSRFSDALAQFGMSNVVYFAVPQETYAQAVFILVCTAFLASLYPAWKAIRLRPVEAIRRI